MKYTKVDFEVLGEAVKQQFEEMAANGGQLFSTAIDGNYLYNEYLEAFPPEMNKIFRERREFDCSCCKSFIRYAGNIVTITPDLSLKTIWDIDVGGYYQIVADRLATLVKESAIKNIFLCDRKMIGTKQNIEITGTKKIIWSHFNVIVPQSYIKQDITSKLGAASTKYKVFLRALNSITQEAVEVVLDLIDQKPDGLYRGIEYRSIVEQFMKVKIEFDKLTTKKAQKLFAWREYTTNPSLALIRNSAIGTLLVDISEQNKSLTDAVAAFESKVAPENYKRNSAPITAKMAEKALKTIRDKGFEASLHRRHAIEDDIPVEHVLYADRSFKATDELAELFNGEIVQRKVPNLDKVEEISFNDFLSNVLPKAESLEVFLQNQHESNLVSLIAPIDIESKSMFKWDNNISWSYNGAVTDSMKDIVKAYGGKTDGALRFSIMWNEDLDAQEVDLDAHCIEPSGKRIYYKNKNGKLDVDVITPGREVAVENIIYRDINAMSPGVYQFKVHNFRSIGPYKKGFRAEIAFGGEVSEFSSTKSMKINEFISVAEVELKADKTFSLKSSMKSKSLQKTLWGLPTQEFHKVSCIVDSPNYWGDNSVGNKHFFFILDKCKSEGELRGFYNEFLHHELSSEAKALEVLSSKLKVKEDSEGQLSGLGFSITKKSSVVVRVKGSFSRVLKINFN